MVNLRRRMERNPRDVKCEKVLQFVLCQSVSLAVKGTF
jgi:hypothetical protein